MTGCDFDVIVLTETWLDNRIHSVQLFGPLYDVYRCDRNGVNSSKRMGGGVLVAVKKTLSSVQLNICDSCLEQVWVKLDFNNKCLYISSFYLPPDKTNDSQVIESHLKSVREIDSCSSCDDTILIFGDYNFSEIHWMKDEQGSVTIDYSISSLNHARYSTIDGMAFCNLHQINPTKNLNGHTLDLVFSNSIDFSVSETNDVLIAPDLHHHWRI